MINQPGTRDHSGAASQTRRLTYAVGDIHGRLDLLVKMLSIIQRDMAQWPGQQPVIILLGDYIDRGPSSKQVVDRIIALKSEIWCDLVTLMGNHEEALIKFAEEGLLGALWCDHGGNATLASYGITPPLPQKQNIDWDSIRTKFLEAVSPTHLAFYKALDSVYVQDDYLFAHAGVMPNLEVWQQTNDSLLWIREPFLSTEKSCDHVVVHGHTPHQGPENKRWRINVDTGAYATNVLTAVRLIGTDRHFLEAR